MVNDLKCEFCSAQAEYIWNIEKHPLPRYWVGKDNEIIKRGVSCVCGEHRYANSLTSDLTWEKLVYP